MYNLLIKQKDDKYYNITFWKDSAHTMRYDITGWTVYFTVKRDLDDTDEQAVMRKIITDHLNPTQGLTQVHFTHDDTDQDTGNYYYDIQCKNVAGDIITVLNGIMAIKKEITGSG